MKKFEITQYNPSYREKLFIYLKKIAYNKETEYIDYCISHSDEKLSSIIVIGENDDIVGCHLFFNTKLNVKGEIKDVAWGHETFLDKEYRSSAGLDFVLAINKYNNTVGMGVTDVNREILKKMKKTVWMEKAYSYFLLNIFFPIGVAKKILNTKLQPLKLDGLIKSKINFRLVKRTDDVVIPNGGYWYDNNVEFDFVRDKEFLEYRFFNNKVFDYSVYEYHNNKGDSCYFVVRPILVKGIPALSLVDYRYYGDPRQLEYILVAVKMIAKKNHIGVVQTIGGIKELDRVFNSLFCYKRQGECIIHKSLKADPSDSISITPADADVDFNS